MLRNYLSKIFLEKYNFLLFLLISFASLSGFLSSDTSFGFIWDWSIPSNEFFLKNKLTNNELYWNNSIYGGYNNPLNFELWYWRFYGLVNLLFFGKGLFGILFIFQCFCYLGFSKIGEIYKKDFFLISLFYIFSYYAFSRLIAGHINLLIFYWSLPILFACIHKLYEKSLKETFIYQLILITVLLITLNHPISIFIYFCLLIFFFYKELLNTKNKKKIFLIFCYLLLIFLISQFHLMLALFGIVFDNLNVFLDYYKSYQDTSQTNSFNKGEFFDERRIQHNQKSLGLVFYIFSLTKNSMFYENVFIFDSIFIKIVFFLSFLILLIHSITISFKKIIILNLRFNYIYLTFIIIIFIFLAGSNNLLSKIFYDLIFNFSKTLFSIFGNPLRFSPIFLFFLSLILLLNANSFVKKLVFIIIIILISKFFFFKFHDNVYASTQPNKIVKKKINFQEIELEKNLSNDKDLYRILILPPSQLTWVYDKENIFSLPWNSTYLSKSNLFINDNTEISRLSNKFFFSINNQDFNFNLFLKINSVKYIIFPDYKKVYVYKDFIKNYNNAKFENYNDYSSILKLNLDSIGLKKSKLSTNKIYIYVVDNFYPEFYCPTKTIYYKNKLDKKKFQFSDSTDDYYVFNRLNKETALCQKKIELKINSSSRNIYNIKTLTGDKINSFVFNNNYDPNWIVIPDKIYNTYNEIIYHIFFNRDNKVADHFAVNFTSNFWNFDKSYEYFTVFNYNELKFYIIKIFQFLFVTIFILINIAYLIKNRWKI